MAQQIAVLIWAQWRTFRNHIPRAGVASVLGNLVSIVWYAGTLTFAVALALLLQQLPLPELARWLAPVLLGICLAWQIVPLFTMSTGWSLQLKKLQMYPLHTDALFGIEVLLRVTASPELIIILTGGAIGLARHPELSALHALGILLLLPFNLLVSLGVRELVLHSFERNRFRELFTLLIVSLGVLPQLLLRSGLGERLRPYFIAVAQTPYLPWTSCARIALGSGTILDGFALLGWCGAAFFAARLLFLRALRFEETPRAAVSALSPNESQGDRNWLASGVERLFRDPIGALIQKELRSLLRMPRFRVAFGMACLFSVLIFVPLAINTARAGSQFMQRNFMPLVTLYGLLILSDTLLLNVFGTDRSAVALYFVAPVPFRDVLLAKNLAGIVFISAQTVIATVAAALLRHSAPGVDVATALGAVAVTGLFFLSAGNFTSVLVARPSDPRQTMRKAAGGKIQLWFLLCTFGMGVLMGAAFLARWALGATWALFVVLAVEFAVGLIVYKVAVDSAVEHALRGREKLIDTLSKGQALVGSGN